MKTITNVTIPYSNGKPVPADKLQYAVKARKAMEGANEVAAQSIRSQDLPVDGLPRIWIRIRLEPFKQPRTQKRVSKMF